MNYLQGKKTYILAGLAIVYALSGYFTGHIDPQTALEMVWAALTSGALRSGIANS